MKITVVNKYACEVYEYIGRGSPLGNPFPLANNTDIARDASCDLYAKWLDEELKTNQAIIDELNRLYRMSLTQDVNLGCFCAPKRCHGDKIKQVLLGMYESKEVRLIIAGGRDFTDYEQLRTEFCEFMKDHDNRDVTIISGMAKGADALALQIADEYDLPVVKMPADWATYGRAAGYRRNAEMANTATHLLAMWDGKSKGTSHMITVAGTKELTTKIIHYSVQPKTLIGRMGL